MASCKYTMYIFICMYSSMNFFFLLIMSIQIVLVLNYIHQKITFPFVNYNFWWMDYHHPKLKNIVDSFSIFLVYKNVWSVHPFTVVNILRMIAFQGFVFCALLEFALVNYASRSDIQRERSRERMERARRQWELENADSMEPSSNSLPRQTKVPSYEATVLHMVSFLNKWNDILSTFNSLELRRKKF